MDTLEVNRLGIINKGALSDEQALVMATERYLLEELEYLAEPSMRLRQGVFHRLVGALLQAQRKRK